MCQNGIRKRVLHNNPNALAVVTCKHHPHAGFLARRGGDESFLAVESSIYGHACLADLLGRQGGLSAFNAEELSALKRVHERHPGLTRTLLKKAFAQAERPSIPAIVFALQKHKEE